MLSSGQVTQPTETDFLLWLMAEGDGVEDGEKASGEDRAWMQVKKILEYKKFVITVSATIPPMVS